MTDTPEAAALRARVAYAIGETRIAAEEEPLQYVLLRGFSALGWAQPSNAAVDMTEAAARAALSAAPAARSDAVKLPDKPGKHLCAEMHSFGLRDMDFVWGYFKAAIERDAAAERGDAEGRA